VVIPVTFNFSRSEKSKSKNQTKRLQILENFSSLLPIILWQGDEDLPPALNILFDASIEQLLSADAIWVLVSCQASPVAYFLPFWLPDFVTSSVT